MAHPSDSTRTWASCATIPERVPSIVGYQPKLNDPDHYIQASHLRLMVGNLLDNAVKYSLENGHLILATVWHPTHHSLVIEMSDTGLAIARKDLSDGCERFFRIERAHTRSIVTGLGLSFVTAIARSYGGASTLHSTGIPGEGTQAVLTLRPNPIVESPG